MDKETIEKVEALVEEVVEEYDLNIEKVIVFGSRAREDYTDSSDIDLLIVSQDFENVAWNQRPGPFYEAWNYDRLPTPEFVCLTPNEFEDKKDRKPHIVNNAAEEGIEIA